MYDKLVEMMVRHNISSYRLSKETGITQATLSRWKTGKTSPSVDTLQSLADYFGVPVDYFLNKKNENSPTELQSGKAIHISNDTEDEDENIQIIHRAAKKMTPENRKKLLDIVKIMFDEEFDDD